MKPVRSVRQFALRFAIVFALSVAAAGVVTPVFAAQATPAAPFASDRLSVEVRGQGPDVIFVPGYTSSREVWNETAERLAATHRVHLVQFSGFADRHGAMAMVPSSHRRWMNWPAMPAPWISRP